MSAKHIDGLKLTVLTTRMPRKKKPEGESMIFLGFKVPPVYANYLPTIVEETNEDFPATVARRLFLRGFAAYLDDGKLWKPEERELLAAFLKNQKDGAREIDVDSTHTYNADADDASSDNHG